MTAEPRDDPLDRELCEALHSVHLRLESPAFDEVWGAAQKAARRKERRPIRWLPRKPAAWAAVVALIAAIGVAVRLPAPPPEDEQDPLSAFANESLDQAIPVVWYAPTDELLQVTSLDYAARPAAMTIYDPIYLEVRP